MIIGFELRPIKEPVVGYVSEWEQSSGGLREHKVHDGAVWFMALSGDMIASCDFHDEVIRLFNVSSCLLVLFYIAAIGYDAWR